MRIGRFWLGAASLTLALLPLGAGADDRVKFSLVLEGRLATTPPSVSFLDGGLGKTGFGHTPRRIEASLSQAALLGRVEPRADLTISAHANVDAQHDLGRRVDLVEAFARYTPALSDRVSLDVKAGLFFPSVSLENTEAAWLSPYTTTFSAINSWVGEEVRSLGVEAGPSILAGEARVNVFGALTTRNDPTGTLLAWRGFALHDRVGGFADQLPPPASAFLRSARPLPRPAPACRADARGRWPLDLVGRTLGPPSALPREGALSTANGQPWRVRRPAVCLAHRLHGDRTRARLRSVRVPRPGVGRRDAHGRLPSGRNAVVAGFRAVYSLGTWASPSSRHRTTLRFDAFQVTDRDEFQILDANAETGHAWTFAYRFEPARHHALTVEILRVDSRRENRRDLGLDPRAIEISGSLSWRLTF